MAATEIIATSSKIISSTVNSYEGYDWAFYIDFTTIEGDDAIYATDYKTIEYGGKTMQSPALSVKITHSKMFTVILYIREILIRSSP